MGFPQSQDTVVKLTCEVTETLLGQLTPVEFRILDFVSQNRTSKSIAQEMHASHRTIQNHRLRMCRKLGLAGYNGLFRFALEHRSAIQLFPRRPENAGVPATEYKYSPKMTRFLH